MGIPLNPCEELLGTNCSLCAAANFAEGCTPKKLQLLVEGIEVCPTVPPDWEVPNGTWLLEQTSACTWGLTIRGIMFKLWWTPDFSDLEIYTADGLWFLATPVDVCTYEFDNGLEWCDPGNMGRFGTATIKIIPDRQDVSTVATTYNFGHGPKTFFENWHLDGDERIIRLANIKLNINCLFKVDRSQFP